MCKETIEKAALIKGVRMASWNKETDSLKVVFKSGKIAEADIQKAVALSGYDTPLFKAEEVNYSNLPGCCAYREETEKH
ncbi:MAG: mercuric ion binding protein [Limisphaerales bacterium]|jgi:mercuric ion binding protein